MSLPIPKLPVSAHAPDGTGMAEVHAFSRDVLAENSRNVRTSNAYIRRSFRTLYCMYVILFCVGVVTAVAAIVKGFLAQSLDQASGAVVLAGLSSASFFALFLSRPLESLERNTIYSAWLTAVTNTYWTRLAYFDDPSSVDADVSRATSELVTGLRELAQGHAAASGHKLPAGEAGRRSG